MNHYGLADLVLAALAFGLFRCLERVPALIVSCLHYIVAGWREGVANAQADYRQAQQRDDLMNRVDALLAQGKRDMERRVRSRA